ncbi:MAG: right-handed parallel beta-helix repeat-containing protein, partial [Chromatiales bacterium]
MKSFQRNKKPLGLKVALFLLAAGMNAEVVAADATVSSAEALVSAIASADAGSTIYIRAGIYYFSDTINLAQSGSKSKMITLSKHPDDDERPVLDFSAMSESVSNRGLMLQGDYWQIYGIDVREAGDSCLYITGSNNLVEFSTFSECADSGVQLAKGASDNLIKNVDSYYNADSSLEKGDGFGVKLDVGDGNKFYGCRAWNNLDDGFNGYLRGANNVTTTYENTWVFRNGYLKDGSRGAGDGNGFKTGGSDNKDLKHHAVFINTIAAGNVVDGYDHNNNRGEVTIYNAIAHDNGINFSFKSNNPASKLTLKNTISIGGSDNLEASSTDIEANSWQDGHSVTQSDFVSMDIDELLKPRKADGSLPDVDYFKLVNGSDLIDAGVDVGLPYDGAAPDIGAFESSESMPEPTLDPTATTVSSEKELVSAIKSATAGSTIYIRGGTYYFGETITLRQSGSQSQMISLRKHPEDDERPMLDFSAMSESGSNRGMKLQGDYWHIYGIDLRKAGDNGIYITGSHNVVEFSTFSECADTGVQIAKGGSDNLIMNVDSFYNADSSLENADGFAAKLDVGDGNMFYGCRAWNNLDDGFDGYLRGANNVTTTYENTWVFRNGYLKDGSRGAGDGNGFKTGGSDNKDLKHN